MSVLSRRLRETRRRLGLKQEELARALGVTQGTISRWETGGQAPDLSAMTKLAEMAGYDPIGFAHHEEAHPFRKSDWGKVVEVIGQVAEDVWAEAPEWESSQRFQVQIPTLPEWGNFDIEGFIVSDDNFEPIYKKESIVFIAKYTEKSFRLNHGDYVVVERMDDRGLYEIVIREIYVNRKMEIHVMTLPKDSSIRINFKVSDQHDTTIEGVENVTKIEDHAIRGTVIASFRVEVPYIQASRVV